MAVKSTQYDTCTVCTHTINIHETNDGHCDAYGCSCDTYEGK